MMHLHMKLNGTWAIQDSAGRTMALGTRREMRKMLKTINHARNKARWARAQSRIGRKFQWCKYANKGNMMQVVTAQGVKKKPKVIPRALTMAELESIGVNTEYFFRELRLAEKEMMEETI